MCIRDSSISVLDLSAGVAYRRYLAKRGYLGLEVKYHHVNYSTSGIVDMNSAPITIRLIYGGLMNLRKSQGPVSYTHLTLPTSDLVKISVVAVTLKKKTE